MITAKYLLDDVLESSCVLYANEAITVAEDDLKRGRPAINYITMDGLGVDLYDDTSEFITAGDYCGYISQNVSDSDCNSDDFVAIYGLREDSSFAENNLEITHGITLGFEQNYCPSVKIFAYDKDDDLVFEKEIEITQLYQHIDLDSIICNRVYIYFTKTQYPYSFVKLSTLILGNVHIFDSFSSFDMLDEINLLSDDLPMGQVEFSVFSENDLIGKNGSVLYFFDNSELLGKYYLADIERESKTKYNFTVQNLLYEANNKVYDFYGQSLFSKYAVGWTHPFTFQRPTNYIRGSSADSVTIPGALDELMNYIGVEFEIDKTFYINNDWWFPQYLQSGTARYALQQMCWALGAYVQCSDKIYIKPLSSIDINNPKIIRNSDSRILKTKVKKNDKISNVLWDITRYIGAQSPNITEITKVEVTSEQLVNSIFDVTVNFSKPTKISSIEGGNVLTDCAFENPYKITFPVTEAGTYTLYGYELTSSKQTEIIPVNPTGSEKNYSKYDLILLNGDQYPYLTNKKTELYKAELNNEILTATIVYDGEKTGDCISIQTSLDDMFTGIITSVRFSSSGTYRTAEIEVQKWNT